MERSFQALRDLNKESDILSESYDDINDSTEPTDKLRSTCHIPKLFTFKTRSGPARAQTFKVKRMKSEEKVLLIDTQEVAADMESTNRRPSAEFDRHFFLRPKKSTIKNKQVSNLEKTDFLAKYLKENINKSIYDVKFVNELVADMHKMSEDELDKIVYAIDLPESFYVAPRVCFALVPFVSLSTVSLMVKRMYSFLIETACDEVGADFLVDLLSKLVIRKKQVKVMNIINFHLKVLVQSPNASKVLICVLKTFPLKLTEKVIAYLMTQFLPIAELPHGAELISTIVPLIKKKIEQQRFLKKVIENSRRLFKAENIVTLFIKLFETWPNESPERLTNCVLAELDFLAEIHNGEEIIKVVIDQAPNVF